MSEGGGGKGRERMSTNEENTIQCPIKVINFVSCMDFANQTKYNFAYPQPTIMGCLFCCCQTHKARQRHVSSNREFEYTYKNQKCIHLHFPHMPFYWSRPEFEYNFGRGFGKFTCESHSVGKRHHWNCPESLLNPRPDAIIEKGQLRSVWQSIHFGFIQFIHSFICSFLHVGFIFQPAHRRFAYLSPFFFFSIVSKSATKDKTWSKCLDSYFVFIQCKCHMQKNERYIPFKHKPGRSGGNGWAINVNNCHRIKVRHIWWCHPFECMIKHGEKKQVA